MHGTINFSDQKHEVESSLVMIKKWCLSCNWHCSLSICHVFWIASQFDMRKCRIDEKKPSHYIEPWFFWYIWHALNVIYLSYQRTYFADKVMRVNMWREVLTEHTFSLGAIEAAPVPTNALNWSMNLSWKWTHILLVFLLLLIFITEHTHTHTKTCPKWRK